ncbi:hypothetical protein DPMN_049129 [Dreissena polymorpha]|uniref:Uncharacterized protein n=1 Tax=Dreissena polymorpha TaxID=45954 RepID=A0A9D4I3J5_DREPO|nr:hypothetical protein DPMN_049129 [Dreissena polymorpha]
MILNEYLYLYTGLGDGTDDPNDAPESSSRDQRLATFIIKRPCTAVVVLIRLREVKEEDSTCPCCFLLVLFNAIYF